MLTISLRGIRLHAPVGVYSEEHVLGNKLEVDVDVFVEARHDGHWPFVDYTRLNKIVRDCFKTRYNTLEAYVQALHEQLRDEVPVAQKIRIGLKKYHPPMAGEVDYAQVVFEG